jgi:hypothetical protein
MGHRNERVDVKAMSSGSGSSTTEVGPDTNLGGWEFDAGLILNRPVEEIRITQDGAMLFKFGPVVRAVEAVGIEPKLPVYLGFRSALQVQGDVAVPKVRVYSFPFGVSQEALTATILLVPHPEAPENLAMVVGRPVVSVQPNTSSELPVGPSNRPGGWYIGFDTEGDLVVEVNTYGLSVHRYRDEDGERLVH